jgi:hypothetical protein
LYALLISPLHVTCPINCCSDNLNVLIGLSPRYVVISIIHVLNLSFIGPRVPSTLFPTPGNSEYNVCNHTVFKRLPVG